MVVSSLSMLGRSLASPLSTKRVLVRSVSHIYMCKFSVENM